MAPVRPEIPAVEKVATPATAVAVAVPTVWALRLTVIVMTVVESVLSTLFVASLSVTTGWVVNAEPLVAGATANCETTNCVAGPAAKGSAKATRSAVKKTAERTNEVMV